MGDVAYELDFLADSKVHNFFHVSSLKKVLGHHIVPSTMLPPLDDEGKLILVLEAIIDFRERNLRQHTVREYLVKWKELQVEDATWENEEILQHLDLKFLENKQFQAGQVVMSPSL